MDLATARDISIIVLAIQGIILVAVPGVLFYFLNKGMRKGSNWLKITGLPQAQYYTRLVADKTSEYSVKITEPIIKVDAATTEAKTMASSTLNGLRGRQRRKNV